LRHIPQPPIMALVTEERHGEMPSVGRVFPSHEVRDRLGVSPSGLRRLAAIYERAVGPLPRDERGRVWPEDALEEIQRAREAVQSQRAVSIEAALRGREVEGVSEPLPAPPRPSEANLDAGAAILKELRALRRLLEDQNARLSAIEEENRELRLRLEAPEAAAVAEEVAATEDEVFTEEPRPERSLWRRLAGVFGRG
jgi:hypothetical protein